MQLGASVVGGDRNPIPIEHTKLSFSQIEVTSWTDLSALFKHAKEVHGRIDHVFSNAGITGRANYLREEFDDAGELKEPSNLTFDVDLKAMVNTSYLGLHYMRHQEPPGGSIVCTASAAAFQRFRVTDYTAAKHGVLGWMRGIVPNIQTQSLPIRVNAISPSWTKTGMVPADMLTVLEGKWQDPEAVAKSVAILMADEARQGQVIYSWVGRFMELEESTFLPTIEPIVRMQEEDVMIGKLHKIRADMGYT